MAVCPPRKTVSPLSIFYAYYAAWFIIAPLLATRYQGLLNVKEYVLAAAMAYTVFGIGIISIVYGTRIGTVLSTSVNPGFNLVVEKQFPKWINLLYLFSTAMVMMIIISSGGFDKWISAPGDAFLNRGGSGVYVILSHFSTIVLAGLVGYTSYTKSSKSGLILFIAWVLLTSPIHGSKLHISLLIILAILPWLRYMPIFSLRTIVMYFTFVAVFLLGLYFRNMSWVGVDTIIPYALNYFTAFENLAISVRDFPPSIMTTFFLPFVKFQTPFGLEDTKMYYDMNHMLTDIYYPSAWAIRATEQWPVETDLYLNFMFFGGLPLIVLYLGLVGFIYGRALKYNTLGYWLASFLMIVFMISHLRGSLVNHTDFYMYPFIFFVVFLFKDVLFKDKVTLK